MTTGNQVFDMAINLMDEQNESSGATVTADTKEYRLRSVNLLNVLRHECFRYSDTFRAGENGGRAICAAIETLDDALDLDDAIAQGALPYGLASRLLLGENDTLADFFEQKFSEMLTKLGNSRPAQFESIPLYYGTF